MRQALIKSNPLVLDGVFVTCSERIENVCTRDSDSRGSGQLARRARRAISIDCFAILSVLSVASAAQHVGGLSPLDVTKELIRLS